MENSRRMQHLQGLALTAPALVPNADATIVYSGPINLSIPNNFDGVYINLVTGATGTAGGSVAWMELEPIQQRNLHELFLEYLSKQRRA